MSGPNTDVEAMVEIHRDDIVRCIREPSIVSHLVPSVITSDDGTKLRDQYDKDTFNATETLLDLVVNSTEPGKWKSFVDALDSADYKYLSKLLKSNDRPDSNHKHERKMLQIFAPVLEEQINSMDIIDTLFAKEIINDVDRQEVFAKRGSKGNMYATIVLLDRIQCRQSPKTWYGEFLSALCEAGYEHIVQDMDPDYLKDGDCISSKRKQDEIMDVDIHQKRRKGQVDDACVASTSGMSYVPAALDPNTYSNIQTDFQDVDMSEDDMDTPLRLDVASRLESVQDTKLDLKIKQETIDKDFQDVDISEVNMDTPSRLDVELRQKSVQDTKLDLKIEQETEEAIDKVCQTSTCKQEPIKPEPFKPQPIKPQPINQQPIKPLLIKQEPIKQQPIKQQPIKPQPIKQQPIKQQPIKPQPFKLELETENDGSPKSDNKADAFNPLLNLRKYQQELADKVTNKNVIICEGTGIGKTRVALQIIKKHLKSSNGQGKVAFMGVNNILVKQQFEKCRKLLPQYSAMIISSQTDGQSEMLGAFIPDNDILFFTPQILVNNLESKNVERIGRFSLLVFDECHHTKKGNNPYHKIMRNYLMDKNSRSGQTLPQIVGLTASTGVGNSHTPEETRDHILNLCARMDIEELPTVETNKEELSEFTAKPTEDNILFQKRKYDPCERTLLDVIDDIEENDLQDNIFSVPTLIPLMTKCPKNKESLEYNKWTVDVIQAAHQIEGNPEISRNIIACAQYLNTFSAALEVNRLLETDDVIKTISQKHLSHFMHRDKLCDTEKELLQKLKDARRAIAKKGKHVKNPNVSTISNILRQMLQEKGDDSRAMVFVKTRAACKSLAELFGRELESCSVRVKPLYGKGKRGLDEGMEEKEQNDIVEKFRDGYYKVLVATAIGIEGIDIPNCNIALCYEFSKNEITKIQMKGRIRQHDGSLVNVNSEKSMEQVKINIYKEAMMYNGLDLARRLRAADFLKRVKFFQEDEFQKFKIEQNRLKIEQEREKPDVDFEVKCIICGTFVCNISQVRKIGVHHIVIDQSFVDKIDERPLTSKWNGYDGFQKKFKLGCKRCTNEWGVAADIKGPLCYTLRLTKFKFKIRTADAKFVFFKNWDEVPYRIPEITEDEIKTFSSAS